MMLTLVRCPNLTAAHYMHMLMTLPSPGWQHSIDRANPVFPLISVNSTTFVGQYLRCRTHSASPSPTYVHSTTYHPHGVMWSLSPACHHGRGHLAHALPLLDDVNVHAGALTSSIMTLLHTGHFCRATLYVSSVLAVARCLSVCHVGELYPHGWRDRQTSFSTSSPSF